MTFASAYRTFALCLLPVAFAGCAAHAFVPPTGVGEPAPDAASAWTEASAGCRDAQSYTAFFNVSGRVDGERIRSIGIDGVVTAGDEARLNGVAFGRPVFVLAGRADRATIVLGDRFLIAPAGDIVDALAGIRLTPRELMALVGGCVSPAIQIQSARRYGPTLGLDFGSARAYLRQRDAAWTVVFGEIGQRFTVEYGRFTGAGPGRIVVRSTGTTRQTALTIRVDDRELNRTFPASTFAVNPPPNATPMTLDELRSALRGR